MRTLYWRENLKRFRKMNGMTQQQIADVLKIERTAYANYELGRTNMNIETLCKVSEFFGVTVEQMLFASPNEDIVRKSDLNAAFPNKDCPRLFDEECRHVGYLTQDERRLLILYRAYDDKAQIQVLLTPED